MRTMTNPKETQSHCDILELQASSINPVAKLAIISKSVSYPSSHSYLPNLLPPSSASTTSRLTTSMAPANLNPAAAAPSKRPRPEDQPEDRPIGQPAEPGHYPYSCFRCEAPRAFGTCDGWKRHMREHETVFPCRQCEYSDTARNARSYTRKANLVEHLFDTHNMSDSDASARAHTWCELIYSSLETLWSHLKQ